MKVIIVVCLTLYFDFPYSYYLEKVTFSFTLHGRQDNSFFIKKLSKGKILCFKDFQIVQKCNNNFFSKLMLKLGVLLTPFILFSEQKKDVFLANLSVLEEKTYNMQEAGKILKKKYIIF